MLKQSPPYRALTRSSLVPGDLGLRLETYPEIGMTVDEAVANVAGAAKKHNKVWARTASSIAEVDRYRRQGSLMIPHGGDFALKDVLQKASAELDQMLGWQPGLAIGWRLVPGGIKQAQPVAVHDVFDVGPGITARRQQARQSLQIGYRVQIAGRLFPPKSTVEIAADGGMTAAARKLADMVDMVDDVIE